MGICDDKKEDIDRITEALQKSVKKIGLQCRITFHYFVLGNMEKIESIAMGTLVDNLLNNGIEACMEITEGSRELEIVMQHTKTGVEILQENSIAKSVIQNNPNLQSRKEDAPWHGFGMKSIYHIVEEWEGMYEYWEEQRFLCSLCVMISDGIFFS
ncbi:MAG: GHKL domain-containing protein [Lachnospiraceae bacterium]|nr:GHKL domain-containing protein [Lachnospiraceae bacterium]